MNALVFQTCFRIGQLMAVNDVDRDAMEANLAATAVRRINDETEVGDAARKAFHAWPCNAMDGLVLPGPGTNGACHLSP